MELVERLINQEIDFIKSQCLMFASKYKVDKDTLLGVTLEKCWEHRATFKSNEENGFKKWITICVRNHSINIHRQETASKKGQHSHQPLYYYGKDSSNEEIQYIQLGRKGKDISRRDIICKLLLKVRKTFPDLLHYRIIFYMNYQGYKYQEMADKCGIPVGTVRSTLHRLNKFIESEKAVLYE